MSEFSSKPQTDVFESIWKELKLLMEWQDGFALFWMMVDDTRAVIELRQRLNDYMHCHVKPMRYIQPQIAESAAADTVQQIFHSEHIKGHPIWLDLSALDSIQDSNGPWHQAREKTLSLLNKRRSQLENRIDSPIFIQLPRSFGPRIVEVAPDLWSVRQQVIDLPVVDTLTIGADMGMDSVPLEFTPVSPVLPTISEGAVTQVRKALASAEARFEKNSTYVNRRNLAIKQSELAEQLTAIGNVPEALELAKKGQQHFQYMLQKYPEHPQVLRDLSIALDRLGSIEQALGNLATAKSLFEESLLICKKLHQDLGDNIKLLRDISINLERIGTLEQALGNMRAAKPLFEESLLICRKLLKILGNTPGALRDLSVALDNVGVIEYLLGSLTAAKLLFEEGLGIRRNLHNNLGDLPEVLRDISVSLEKIGIVESELGYQTTAKSFFEESLSVRRKLHQDLGDTPEVLRDISVSLNRIGDIEQALDKLTTAKSLFEESLSIRQRLYQSLGPLPKVVNDYGYSLITIIILERQLGNSEAAERYQQELERLKSEHPDYLKNA